MRRASSCAPLHGDAFSAVRAEGCGPQEVCPRRTVVAGRAMQVSGLSLGVRAVDDPDVAVACANLYAVWRRSNSTHRRNKLGGSQATVTSAIFAGWSLTDNQRVSTRWTTKPLTAT